MKKSPLFRPMQHCAKCGKFHTPAPLCNQGFTPIEVVFEWIGNIIYMIFALFLLTPLAVGIAHTLQWAGLPKLDDHGVVLLLLSYGSAAVIVFGIYKAWPKIRRFV